jgi:hypothetical protein
MSARTYLSSGLSRGFRIGLVCILLAVVGCSESTPPEAASEPAFSVFGSAEGGEGTDDSGTLRRVAGDDDANPVVESLRLEPKSPVSRGRVRAVAGMSGRWTAMEYSWDINGKAFGGSSAEVVLPIVETGDTITVEVVPVRGVLRGSARSASVSVKNQPPMIVGLGIEIAKKNDRGPFDETERWIAIARAEDPDGDSIRFEYRWFVNGQEAEGDDEFFSVGDLARGDRLEVEVRAFDGRVSSGPARSGEVEVGNSPPKIVSVPPRVDARGQFRYAIRAEDPDGDQRLRFALREAPKGMQIDDANGIVRWEPDTDQAGRHAVEIVVTDEGGAESSQSFSLALVQRTDDVGPGPAAPR